MYYTYVLKSLSHGTLYIGSAENPEDRLKNEHNQGRVRYTKGRLPWVLIYKEEFSTRKEAMRQEGFFKTGKGRENLKNFLTKTAGSSSGRIHDSESCHLGSNPSPAVLVGIKKKNI